MNRVLIIGYGEMGHAMEYLLSVDNDIVIHDPAVAGEPSKTKLSKEAPDADIIVFCTPTEPLLQLATELKLHIKEHCVCLTMAKALNKKGNTAFEALAQGFGGSQNIAVLYGPMIAEEFLRDRPGYALIASTSEKTLNTGLQLFATTQLKLKPGNDPDGAALCAALKNPYAILFGIADGLGLGDNVRGMLSVEALSEMAAIVATLQGEPLTPYTLAGLGDLITTATSNDSHHHQLGIMLANNDRSATSGEGVNTLRTLNRQKIIDLQIYPYLQAISNIVVAGADPNTELESLL